MLQQKKQRLKKDRAAIIRVNSERQHSPLGYASALPDRTDAKVLPASGLGLPAVHPRIPAHAGHVRLGPEAANSLLRRSCADGAGTARMSERDILAGKGTARMPEHGILAGERPKRIGQSR